MNSNQQLKILSGILQACQKLKKKKKKGKAN